MSKMVKHHRYINDDILYYRNNMEENISFIILAIMMESVRHIPSFVKKSPSQYTKGKIYQEITVILQGRSWKNRDGP